MDRQIDAVRRRLVVDDEPIQCLIVTLAMSAFGFAADSASSLEEASSRITRQAYDVVILDLSVGAGEGISLLPMLAGQPADPVVIFTTRLNNRAGAAVMQSAADLGLRVAGAMAKPVGPLALRALLDKPPPQRIRFHLSHADPPTAEEPGQAVEPRNERRIS